MRWILYIFVNDFGRIRDIRRKVSQWEEGQENDVLLANGPSPSLMANMEKEGYHFSNWHLIREATHA